MVVLWTGFGPGFVSPDCLHAPNLGFTVVPGQSTHVLSLGGMGIHVSSRVSAERQNLALDFVQWQISQEQQRVCISLGGFPSRKSSLATGLFINRNVYNPIAGISYPVWSFLPFFNYLLMCPFFQIILTLYFYFFFFCFNSLFEIFGIYQNM